jgi:pseudouridine-5'-phosphate glycosidase/pseudouridine kinase
MHTSGIVELGPEVPNARTAQYVSINDSGKNLVLAMADMDILTSDVNFDQHRREFRLLEGGHVVVDGNWSPDAIRKFLIRGRELSATCVFEPVSVAKSERIFLSASGEGLEVYPRGNVQMATPNAHELKAMYEAAALRRYFDRPDWFTFIDALDIGAGGARDRFTRVSSAAMTDAGVPQQCLQLLPFFPTLVVTMGDQGVFLAQVLKGNDPRLKDPDHAKYVVARARAEDEVIAGVYMRLYPAVEKVDDVVSVNGVGDTFLGALVAGMAKGGRVDQLINTAQKAAVMSLRSREAVSPLLGKLTAELDMLAAESKAPRAQQTIEDEKLSESEQDGQEKQQLLEWEGEDAASTEMDEQPTLPVLPDNDQFWGHATGVPPIPEPESISPPEQPSRRAVRPDNRDSLSSVSQERWGEPTGIPPIPRGERRFQPKN